MILRKIMNKEDEESKQNIFYKFENVPDNKNVLIEPAVFEHYIENPIFSISYDSDFGYEENIFNTYNKIAANAEHADDFLLFFDDHYEFECARIIIKESSNAFKIISLSQLQSKRLLAKAIEPGSYKYNKYGEKVKQTMVAFVLPELATLAKLSNCFGLITESVTV